MPLRPDDLETVWTDLAVALDGVPATARELFLTKLVLALAQELDDIRAFGTAVTLASRSLSNGDAGN
ncbi:MAG: DUF2783 domain-containing protein [Candidatus Eremiobacteraeota bacterium]|nr:DUF2783 domain-containing protein [Candidatus Eremiobacteraeota bacterium]